ncbi:hypothetical protein [Rhizobium hainanense]|uniref:Uncharacterized protein n=1 Tax=Rhizobium hainanense TaxID=52131 RepID=A0A1C3V198_9HYPH|nr:hypothetical protein [Rhizobium hainanense]SCB21454.1 hypothetical protein GA0061100_10475 [Rhizobium hainanense]
MSVLAIGYYSYACGLIFAVVSALRTRRRVLRGLFGKFAIFEHIILPIVFVIVGITIYSLVEVDKLIVTGIIIIFSALTLVMLMVFAPFLVLAFAFLAYAFTISWEEVTGIIALSFIGATIGNVFGYGWGSWAARVVPPSPT